MCFANSMFCFGAKQTAGCFVMAASEQLVDAMPPSDSDRRCDWVAVRCVGVNQIRQAHVYVCVEVTTFLLLAAATRCDHCSK